MNRPFAAVVIAFALLVVAEVSVAQSFTEDFSIWPVDLRINGTVITCTGPEIAPTIVAKFIDNGGGKDGKFVAVWLDMGFDGKSFESPLDSSNDSSEKQSEDRQSEFKKFGHDKPLDEFDETEFRSLNEAVATASGVLLFSSRVLEQDGAKWLSQSSSQLHRIITDGGAVCGVGPVVSHFGKFRSESIRASTRLDKGLNLIPDAIVYGGYEDKLERPVMNSGIAMEPLCVGIGIPENTGAILQGRKFRAYGDQKVVFAITANDRQSYRVQRLAQSTGRRSNPYKTVVDLTAWRRDAIERQLPAFPPAKSPNPVVENGTLFIVGGGGMPRGMMSEFVEMAGGDDAQLIYVPCTESKTVAENPGIVRQWKAMGVASAQVIHTKDRNRANSNEAFLKPLEKATGIWFGGGRQWNFVDSYYGTQAHKLMKGVLKRGGVIGGSSAGASVQGSYLARANPVANFDIMAAGYERGLGFLNGVAIDQHFSQRGRQKDMTQLADRYPQLLGIGIDEGTAIKVQGSIAQVVGRGKVFFYDRRQPVIPGQDDFLALESGSKFDLVERKVVEQDAAETDSDSAPSGNR